jgi:hypothetical protein
MRGATVNTEGTQSEGTQTTAVSTRRARSGTGKRGPGRPRKTVIAAQARSPGVQRVGSGRLGNLGDSLWQIAQQLKAASKEDLNTFIAVCGFFSQSAIGIRDERYAMTGEQTHRNARAAGAS